MKQSKIQMMCLCAMFMALTFVVTRFIQVPIPLGYFNIGNSVILFGCLFLEMPYGIIMGAVGSALADLTSYPEYTIPTFIIKALMPLVFYIICRKQIKSQYITKLIAAAVATLIPLFGYTLTGGIIMAVNAIGAEGADFSAVLLRSCLAEGLLQFPGLALEYGANLIIFAFFCKFGMMIPGAFNHKES